MKEIKEQINELNALKKNAEDEDVKKIIDEIIKEKQEDGGIAQKVESFIENFLEKMEIKTQVEGEPTLVLEKLYNDFVQIYYTPNAKYVETQKIINNLKDEMEKTLNNEQKVILKEITFCYQHIQSDIALEAFIYGYAMSNQMKTESVMKYPRKEIE